jgi:hypothetical protein
MKYIKKEETKFVENQGDILACRYFHSFAYPNGDNSIGDCGTINVDGKKWDIFHVHYETKDAYYGIPMLGFGLIDCMILKSDTRPFLSKELKNYKLGMFGSHTRKYVRSWNIDISPIINKL